MNMSLLRFRFLIYGEHSRYAPWNFEQPTVNSYRNLFLLEWRPSCYASIHDIENDINPNKYINI